MKKLKFMLAAATALGLATASQAATKPGVRTLATENFNAKAVGAFTASGEWSVALADDNESEIVAKDGADNYLKVSVGTDPLLRAIDYGSSAAQPLDIATEALTIDTMVQFTVTPATDTVEAGTSDKLMIYLKESETNELGVATTNLMVKALSFRARTYDEDTQDYVDGVSNVTDVVAVNLDGSAVTVTPNAWHRLTVKARKFGDETMFEIYLDQTQLKPNSTLNQAGTGDDAYLFPSLLAGSGSTTLQYVGFAGEGAVDDLVFTQDTTLSSLDFTFEWPTGITPISYTIDDGTAVAFDNGATSPVVLSEVIYPDSVVKFLFQNADGVQKEMSVVASLEDNGLDAADEPFGWADYLGEAVDGAYTIDDLAELVLFKKGVATLGTSGQTFKLGTDIDATDLGYWDGIGTASGTNGSSGLNNCTFDGAGYTISNVKFTNAKYRGFFNQVLNSTIKDLTINVVDIAQPANASSEHGYSAFAGNMKNSKIQNCTATGTIGTTAKPAMHTCGGFAVKSDGGNVFENCTNHVDIVCSLTDNPKIGGIFGLGQTGASALTNCWNFGDITITCKTCGNAANGAGGLVGYSQSALTIYGGGNAGTVQSTDTTAATGTAAIKAGAIIGMQTGTGMTATVSGGTVAQADAAPAGSFAQINGLDFATVDGTVATFADTLAAGNTYKVMNAAATATYEFTATGTIAFDTTLATPTYAITAGTGLKVTSATADVVTYYATDWASAPAEHPWYENPAAVVLAANLPGQTKDSNNNDAYVYAFHGQGDGEYLGMTYSTNPMQFDLYQLDGTNEPTKSITITSSQYATAGLRGVAISKNLGVALMGAYYCESDAKDTYDILAVSLDGSDTNSVSRSQDTAFDAAAFSPDGQYLFSNKNPSNKTDRNDVCKWRVSNGGKTLTYIGSVSAGGRVRNIAYARINGRDLVFAMIDDGKVAVIDMTGDASANWGADDLVATGLPNHSYGSLCVSGVKVTGGTPHLTVATSLNGADKHADVLNVYELTVPATGAVTASLVKSFDEAAMTAAGFGDISDSNRYGNTVYVTEDEATIYFGRPDAKLYAAQYAAPAPTGEEVEPGQQSAKTYATQAEAEAALANVTIVAPEDVETNATITTEAKTAYLEKFEKKVVAVEGGSYKVEVALTAAATTALQAEVDADAAEVIEDLSEATVTLTTTSGFYYSLEYGTTLDNMAEVGPRTLATGTSLELPRPTTTGATSGFYRVLVNIVPAAPTQN